MENAVPPRPGRILAVQMAFGDKYRYHFLNRIRHQAADLAEKVAVEEELLETLAELRMEKKQLKKDLYLLEKELHIERQLKPHEILAEMRMERQQLKKDLYWLEEVLQKERRRNHNIARALIVARSQIRRLKKRFFSSSL